MEQYRNTYPYTEKRFHWLKSFGDFWSLKPMLPTLFVRVHCPMYACFQFFIHTAETYFLNEVNDITSDSFHFLTSDIHFLECQIQEYLTNMYFLVGRLFPSEVLTQLLGRPATGVALGDLLIEVACQNITATLLHNLKHGEFFASRPLVEFSDNNGTKYIGQVGTNDVVYKGVKYVEKYTPGKIMTFLINDAYYVFDNYTLSMRHENVQQLLPALITVQAPYSEIDFSNFVHLFPSSDNDFDDLSGILQAVSRARLMHDQLYHFIGSRHSVFYALFMQIMVKYFFTVLQMVRPVAKLHKDH